MTWRLADRARLTGRLAAQEQVIPALDDLQPDVGHAVLWALRDRLSGEIPLARSLLSGPQGDLAALRREVQDALPVPIRGVVSDGQPPIRGAVALVPPGVPHRWCQCHDLREAAKPLFEADRHARKERKRRVRGVRPLARAPAGRADEEAAATRG